MAWEIQTFKYSYLESYCIIQSRSNANRKTAIFITWTGEEPLSRVCGPVSLLSWQAQWTPQWLSHSHVVSSNGQGPEISHRVPATLYKAHSHCEVATKNRNQVHRKWYLNGTSAIGPQIKEATLSFKVMSPASLTIPDILTDKGAWSYLADH